MRVFKPPSNSHKPKGPLSEIASRLRTKAFDLEELVAENIGLKEIVIEDIRMFPNVHDLYIARNQIRVLNNLQYNYRISFLDARYNHITEIDLPSQEYMRELYLSCNELQDLDANLNKLAHMRDLQVLDLRNNPLCLEKGYRLSVISRIPTLKILDGIDVTAAERRRARIRESGSPTPSGRISRRSTASRPRSVLETLLTRPLSAADSVIKERSRRIREKRIMEARREEEEATAIARKRKEDFERAALVKVAPMPDGLDYLGKALHKEEAKQEARPKTHQSFLRMYLVQPVFTDAVELTDGERRCLQFNPRLPPIFRRVEHEKKYPK
jgi:hypothetical protein